ncbi:dipeptide/oligopeptide/nickel ABC transporter ATP-binding protein [Micromonospora sonchi]|uniref:Dipeptide/oligopeptide/nickel ABC transporter ATP-binding protein n=1 Tax=Micromonospora sonchi TaxID=1763543 RepID=A0A917U4Z7_9ACTN|nr:ABC transporter ATP-binding protein [Micromonospora sonchi]GGM54941.1 dipeptide/oligopeptide/nickel ABC transporter ATP-binding protein [Micromonospora sonchi]
MNAQSEELALEVRNLAVSIKTPHGVVHPVKGVDLTVHKGEIVGIVGESGCGKSTTIKGLLRLLPANSTVTADKAQLAGYGDLLATPVRRMREVRGAKIGFVAQNPFGSLNPIYKIERQFYELQKAHKTKVSRKESREIALRMLDGVGIVNPARVLDGYAHQLSGGMAQRVVIALATTLSPQLLIADEPTTGLDATVQAQILDLISGFVHQEGRSMVLVTHDLGVIAQYCQRVVVMYDGQVVEHGSVMDVMVEPQHPYTQRLIASVPKPGEKLDVSR